MLTSNNVVLRNAMLHFTFLLTCIQIKLPRQYAYNWHGNPYEGEERAQPVVSTPETAYDLALLGAEDPSQSAAILFDFIELLRTQRTVPILVAIDSINQWDTLSPFRDPWRYKRIPARQLSLVYVFDSLFHHPPTNGVTVVATTGHGPTKHSDEYLSHGSHVYELAQLTHKQTEDMIKHYSISSYVNQQIDDELNVTLKTISGNVPKTLFDVAAAF
jgi:hypothetical protein